MIDTGLTDTEGRVLGVLADAEHEGRLVADLAAPVAIPSVTGTGAEADAQQWVPGVGGDPQAVPALVLQGHVDVVPAGDRAGWPADPFTAQVVATPGGPVVRGRGTCDMKAGLVAALAAVAAVTEAGCGCAARSPCTAWSARRMAGWAPSARSHGDTPAPPA